MARDTDTLRKHAPLILTVPRGALLVDILELSSIVVESWRNRKDDAAKCLLFPDPTVIRLIIQSLASKEQKWYVVASKTAKNGVRPTSFISSGALDS